MTASLATQSRRMGDAPLLLVGPGSSTSRGTALVLHGLGASKDVQLRELELLARADYLAIGVDAPGHGERYDAELERRLEAPSPERQRRIVELVQQASNELPTLISQLFREGLARPGALGIIGISFGAYTLYRTLLRERRITAAVAMIGSPDFGQGIADSPHLHPERMFPTALLSIGAGRDTTVPPGPAADFHASLVPHYAFAPERQQHLLYPESDHTMREEDWWAAWARAVQWLDAYLKPSGG